MQIVSGKNIECTGASDNYSFTLSVVSGCIGAIAIFASSAVLHVITREKEDLRHDMSVKMAICQAILDILSGVCMIVYSLGIAENLDTFFWLFSNASIWNFTFILGRYRFILARPDEATRYRHWELNARIYVAIFMGFIGVSFTLSSLEIEDTSLFYCEEMFGSIVGNIGSAAVHLLMIFVIPLALTIKWLLRIGRIFYRQKVIMTDSNAKAGKKGGVDFDSSATMAIFIMILILAAGSRWGFILFKPLTYQTLVGHEVMLGLTLVAAGVKSVANPVMLWQLHEFCASEGSFQTS